MYNVFEDVLPERRGAEVQRIKNALVQQGALGASMSGTGSTVFGLFDREEAARRAYELLQESYRDTFLARSLEKWYRNRDHRPQCRHYIVDGDVL